MNKLTLRSLGGAALLALAASPLLAAPIEQGQRYRLSDLGALPGKKESLPGAINRAGSVAGYSAAGDFTETAFRFNAKTGILENIGGKSLSRVTRGFGLNDEGTVVGDAAFNEGGKEGAQPTREAAVFRGGTTAILGRMSKTQQFSRALDINNRDMIVGFASTDAQGTESSAFVWTKEAGLRGLGTLGGDFTQAYAINDSGYIAGVAETAPTGKGGTGEKHAFLALAAESGNVDRLLDLGTLGGAFSHGTAISEKGHVVGHSSINRTDGRFHAFLSEGGKMRDLGSLAQDEVKSDQSFALGVNSAGVVVGYAFLSLEQAMQMVGFVYHEGKMQDLNTLIGRSMARRYLIYRAEAINENGQIAATAFDRDNIVFRAVVLTPEEAAGLE